MKINVVFIFLILCLIFSCKNKGEKSEKGVVLHSQRFERPDKFKHLTDQEELLVEYSFNKKFENAGMNYIIDVESIQLDSLNSYIQSIKIILATSNYDFYTSSSIDPLKVDLKTENSFKTIANIKLGYFRRSMFFDLYRSEKYKITSDGGFEMIE